MTLGELRLTSTTRGFIVGQTGSGKTFLAEKLVPSTGRVAIIDPKNDFKSDAEVFTDPHKLFRARPERFRYAPSKQYFDDLRAYNAVYDWVFDRTTPSKPTYLYTDEILAILTPGYRAPRAFGLCVQLGRGKGITMMHGTQRPACIPKNLITESAKIYLFRLIERDDVRRMLFVTGRDASHLPKREFWYCDLDRRRCKKLTLTLPGG